MKTHTSPNPDDQLSQEPTLDEATEAVSDEQRKIQELQLLLANSMEREKRVLADYQNLQKRSSAERLTLIKMANKELCQALLQPLEHLSMAALNLHDKGLDMVLEQFWKELSNFGLQEINVLGLPFDVATMEAVDTKAKGEKVVGIVRKGYSLGGEIIQHAQVVLD